MTQPFLDSISVDGTVQATTFSGSGSGLSATSVPVAAINASGTLASNVFLCGDGTWKTITSGIIAPTPAITSFSSLSGNLEVGQTVNTPSFSASYNTTPTSVTLYDSVNATPVTLSSTTSFSSTHNFIRTTAGNVSFTLTANFSGTPTTASAYINWLTRTYYGHLTTFTTVTAMQSNVLTGSHTGNYTITAGTGEYLYFAIPTALGTPTFSVGGFTGGISLQTTSSYTNTYGVTTAYSIYKSDNPSLGTISVVLS